MNIKTIYKENKAAKVNALCVCPSCGELFTKKNYQQAFCKNKGGTVCKDKYWNTVIPTKRNNTTRISPASARWSERNRYESDIDFDDDQSWDAHKDSF